jgi:hypothetical protein
MCNCFSKNLQGDLFMAKLQLHALGDPLVECELIEPRTTGFWLTVGSLIFVLMGAFLLTQSDPTQTLAAWGAIVFFGLCLIVGLLKLFGKRDTIKFDQSGFTFTNLGQSNRMTWDQFSSFGTYRNGLPLIGAEAVGMNLVESQKTKASNFANKLVGFDGSLPTSYGVKPKILAEALQKRLDAYLLRTRT